MAFAVGFTLTFPNGSTRDVVFDSESILIGSGPSTALRLDDASVSSIHAVVKRASDNSVAIIDLGSENGTSINGAPVSEPAKLKAGDEIRVGDEALVVTQLGEETAAPKAHVLANEEATVQTTASNPTPPQQVTVETQRPLTDAQEVPKTGIIPVPPLSTEPVEEASQLAPADEEPATLIPAAQAPQPEPEATASADPTSVLGGGQKFQETQVVRERKETPVTDTQQPVTPQQDLDASLLARPLDKANQPTNDDRVLSITLQWGDTILDKVEVKQARDVTVGGRAVPGRSGKGGRKFDLEVDGGFPAEKFVIAHNKGSEAEIVIPSDAKVGLRSADGQVSRQVSLSPTDAAFPAQAYNLKLGERLAYKTGNITVVAQYVRGDAAMGVGRVMDWYFPRILAISFLLHVFFVVAAFMTPRLNTGLVDDLFKNQNRFAQMILKAPEEEKKREKLDLSGMKGGAKAKDDEGKFGKKDKPKKDAVASKAGAPRVDPNKREKDRKIAMNAGLLGMLKGESGAVSNVFGPGGLGTGINDAMGGLRGAAMGDAGGAGGDDGDPRHMAGVVDLGHRETFNDVPAP